MQLLDNGMVSGVLPVGGGIQPNEYDPGGDIGMETGGSYDLGASATPWGFAAEPIQIITVPGQAPQNVILGWWNFTSITLLYGEPGVGGATGGGTTTGCSNAISSNKIDWNYVAHHEMLGSQPLTTGYVPMQNGYVIANSGVTIAAGFDIGQHSISDLNHMGLSQDLVTNLMWYTQLTKNDAVSALNLRPLTITNDDVLAINKAAHSEALSRLVTSYDSATQRAGGFWLLPSEAQTAIADMAFQFGSINQYHSNLWSDIISSNWSQLVSDLKLETSYTGRRTDEANLLQSGMNNNHLKQGQPC